MIAYFNGTYMEKDAIRISPDDRGFLFADGLYEVVRSYDGRIFRCSDHVERLNFGAKHLKLAKSDFSEIEEISYELLKRNTLEVGSATVYIQVTRGTATKRTHSFPKEPSDVTIYAFVSSFDEKSSRIKQDAGIHAITVPDIRWARCDMKTTALTANILANQRASEHGASEAIFVRDGVMIEGSHSNFMAVIDNVLVTAPLSNYILGGITRKVVLEICRKENIAMQEGPIFMSEIDSISEMMIAGTTVEITPIVKLNHSVFREGVPGAVTRRLQEAFRLEIERLKSE